MGLKPALSTAVSDSQVARPSVVVSTLSAAERLVLLQARVARDSVEGGRSLALNAFHTGFNQFNILALIPEACWDKYLQEAGRTVQNVAEFWLCCGNSCQVSSNLPIKEAIIAGYFAKFVNSCSVSKLQQLKTSITGTAAFPAVDLIEIKKEGRGVASTHTCFSQLSIHPARYSVEDNSLCNVNDGVSDL